ARAANTCEPTQPRPAARRSSRSSSCRLSSSTRRSSPPRPRARGCRRRVGSVAERPRAGCRSVASRPLARSWGQSWPAPALTLPAEARHRLSAVSQASELHRIVLRNFPVQLMNRARQHRDALLREFAFIESEGRRDTALARRLLDLAADSEARYADLNPDADARLEDALVRGVEHIDLVLSMPAEIKAHIIEAVP